MSILHKRGKFSISMETIREDPDFVMRLMGMCVIVRAERMFVNDSMEYIALSELFDEVEEEYQTPEYNMIHIEDDDFTFPIVARRL